MGIPISSFTVLKYLADGSERNNNNSLTNYELELALDALSNYSVFAFILHDPSVHKDFHDYFTKNFKRLHYSTGKHLVFIGLVDSPENYILTGENPFYQDARDMINLFQESQSNKQSDSSYASFAFTQSLNIEPDMLPAIVVTHDTRLRTYKRFSTSRETLENQMSRITAAANEMALSKQNENISLEEKQDILFQLLDEYQVDLCNDQGNTILGSSMARALSDILSFLIDENGMSLHDSNTRQVIKISKDHQMRTLRRLEATLRHLQLSIGQVEIHEVDNQSFFPIIEDLMLKLSTCIALLEKKKAFIIPEPIPINENLLENHSYKLLQTALNVESYLKSNNDIVDFSPSAICLAKMFEKEINYSFVHWVRKKLSITLPEFFNRYQPGVEAKATKPGSSELVDFNRGRFGSWAPPELGKSKTIAEFTIKPEEWNSMGILQPSLFLSEWKTIHRIRNKAAHTDKVNESDFHSMKNSLITLADQQIFQNLSNLKSKYKNNARNG